MTKIFLSVTALFVGSLLFVGCNNENTAKNAGTEENNSESLKKELDSAFKKMWQNVTLTNEIGRAHV